MLKIKQELLAGLATALESVSAGAGAKAAFESPKVAAHGDFAVTAAMQLAKPLKLNPRQVGEQLREALLAQPVYQQWVSDIDIAGPGFINIRLKPEAKQQVVREVLEAGDALWRCAEQWPAHDGRVCIGQPHRPAACGPRPPGGAR